MFSHAAGDSYNRAASPRREPVVVHLFLAQSRDDRSIVTARDPDAERAFAVQAVRTLRKHGFTAYWAGGCVRDLLLKITPKDYDVATDATPDEIRRVFGRRRTLHIGAAFGVITVIGPKAAGQIDVATFRSDAAYSDGRHPDAVTFSTPEQDAARRDFTVNGMFYDPINQQVIDFVGGQKDLERKVLRAIGEAHVRIDEDKLRMLRAVRFAATYDLTMDPDTHRAIAEMAEQITVVSPERIAQEMRQMLVHFTRARSVETLRETGLLRVLLPEVLSLVGVTYDHPRQPQGDLWQHTLLVLDLLSSPTFPLTLATLLHATGIAAQANSTQPEIEDAPSDQIVEAIVLDVGRRWRLSKKEVGRAAWLVRHLGEIERAESLPWPKLQRLLIYPGIEELMRLYAAKLEASGDATTTIDRLRDILSRPDEDWNPPPLVDGNDLMKHGVPRGREIRHLLTAVRDAQLEGRIHDKREALLLVDRLRAADS